MHTAVTFEGNTFLNYAGFDVSFIRSIYMVSEIKTRDLSPLQGTKNNWLVPGEYVCLCLNTEMIVDLDENKPSSVGLTCHFYVLLGYSTDIINCRFYSWLQLIRLSRGQSPLEQCGVKGLAQGPSSCIDLIVATFRVPVKNLTTRPVIHKCSVQSQLQS